MKELLIEGINKVFAERQQHKIPFLWLINDDIVGFYRTVK